MNKVKITLFRTFTSFINSILINEIFISLIKKMQVNPKKLDYRPEIDGLRTLAVIPVVLFHLGYKQVIGGYYGVDVFFVISGFLITNILVNKVLNNNFSMFEFWTRRIKRLLPALLTVVLSVLIFSPLIIYKLDVQQISSDVFPTIFSFFNFHAYFEFGSYWGRASEESYFLHSWSLSVEEQFYLLYPFFLFLAYKFFKNFAIPILLVTLFSFIFFFYQLNINKNLDFTFYMLPTRMWELSLGGLGCFITTKKIPTSYSSLISAIGILLISAAYLYGNKQIDYWVIFPVIGTFIVLVFCSSDGLVGKVLSSKPLVLIGKMSYSIYLWHWVLISLVGSLAYKFQHLNFHLLNAVTLGITLILSFLTYFLVENKTRTHKSTLKIVGIGLIIISSFTIFYQSELFNPYYHSKFNGYTSFTKYYDISPSQEELNEYIEKGKLDYGLIIPQRLEINKDAYRKNGIITSEKDKSPEIMLIGDSHGVMWAKVIDEIANDINLSLSCYTSNGTNPFFNLRDIENQNETKNFTKQQRTDYAKSIKKNIEVWKPKLVIIVCHWLWMEDKKKEQFNELLTFLEEMNAQVLLFTQPPKLNFMVNKNASQYISYLGFKPIEGYNLIDVIGLNEIEGANEYVFQLQSKYSNVSVFDIYSNFIQDNKVKVSYNNDILYFDDDHLSYPATLILKKEISAIIKEIIDQSDIKP
ncbi:acyltransferase [Paracrocinitomix mangrovi]|uniref:acyltransferase family protein n=1 Tax=Paracrocinitomix mangrovi TaxID=2862509 RepID=UPI001C8E9638|nr:acyltransferase family protein [Paracrocinitomix mangrovi]UKN02709.1 acyltransferase [Paracrocinitomix mangrovi]